MKQIHVFIADISVVCREGLKQIFRAYDWISISGEANETAELLQLLPLVKCDVILTEIDFKQKGLLFEFDCHENIPKIVVGDAIRLNQIMTNLLGNAIKFTHKGKVSLAVKMI